ncbi:Protein of unknown function [Amycolatopsis marina]|uniref:DUF4232 domain-containing protein n=1 Tax=Amycolatopsis marina TaxID=490629 RepID=A0A1I0XWV1_9PSEU|nr:DUF4232 domain-containing protein [Amycolatopsis marina]SFB05545.1 Protein of unknown function [Amycolatopsis marina]
MGDGTKIALTALSLLLVGACGVRPVAPAQPTLPISAGPSTVWKPGPETLEPGVCPASGVRYEAGPVEAALGHRAVVLTMRNCGSDPRTVSGYPAIAVLNNAGVPLDIEVRHDSSYMARDPGPKTRKLEPGAELLSVVAWSATVTHGELETGAALTVSTLPGEKPQTLAVETDLGTTGKVELTAWDVELAQ